jgi:hypothetical protein
MGKLMPECGMLTCSPITSTTRRARNAMVVRLNNAMMMPAAGAAMPRAYSRLRVLLPLVR